MASKGKKTQAESQPLSSQENIVDRLLDFIALSSAFQKKIKNVRKSEPVTFDHVTPSAQPALTAALLRNIPGRFWIVCPDIKTQEFFHHELAGWFPEILFLPEQEASVVENAIPDPETAAERLNVFQELSKNSSIPVVLTRQTLQDMAPAPDALDDLTIVLRQGTRMERNTLLQQLDDAGYERTPQVASRGHYTVRGGILDIFSWHHATPVRIEFFGDEIESIRWFDVDTQVSTGSLKECSVLLNESGYKEQSLEKYIGKKDLVLDADAGLESATIRITESSESEEEDFAGAFFEPGLDEFEAGDFVIEEAKRLRFFKQLREWRESDWNVFIFCNNEGEQERLRDLFPKEELENPRLTLAISSITRGFVYPASKLAVLSDAELFGRYHHLRAHRRSLRRARELAKRTHVDFTELHEDDYVVHLEYGIGRYLGLQSLERPDGKSEEVMAIEFAEESKLYVPLEQSYLVSRYVGVGKKSPALSSLADGKWAKAKKSAEKAVFDYAAKLLTIHAERETSNGYAFAPDNKWQQEFENSFLYKETPDQLTSITQTKMDMESERPMDRLICGDVGFGKTEVAIRAAFKAVMGGKQVALLVPTTVLAQQHFQNFRERMSDYPITVEMLSRFRSATEQRKTLQGLRDGSVDIVVGTHRLISKDIAFKDLGLVIVDEEQRFGVLHKEKFKTLFKLVDILTLSATPIPRTLYMALMGAKDMSVIETPPLNRIPVETVICGYDERIIRDAIRRELQRQGQVYFLHNRVQSIERIRSRIEMLCPEARVAIGHGQMDEDELEQIMQRFIAGEIDVLISTTIIESGLDIPNANTIIIDRADRFGLADLYQLRGRVGRAQNKAYAYLLLPREMMTVGAARKRINAIKQYSSLGAGFKIAMRDLEIRGAGNILGTAQSGHILAIGFDLYCQLLKQAVARLKGERLPSRVEIPVSMDFVTVNEADFLRNKERTTAPAFLPSAYIEDSATRIQAYRKLAETLSQQDLDTVKKEWRDRFGPFPEAVENLFLLTELKLGARARKITKIEVRDKKLMLTRKGDFILIGGKFPRLTSNTPNLTLREVLSLVNSL